MDGGMMWQFDLVLSDQCRKKRLNRIDGIPCANFIFRESVQWVIVWQR